MNTLFTQFLRTWKDKTYDIHQWICPISLPYGNMLFHDRLSQSLGYSLEDIGIYSPSEIKDYHEKIYAIWYHFIDKIYIIKKIDYSDISICQYENEMYHYFMEQDIDLFTTHHNMIFHNQYMYEEVTNEHNEHLFKNKMIDVEYLDKDISKYIVCIRSVSIPNDLNIHREYYYMIRYTDLLKKQAIHRKFKKIEKKTLKCLQKNHIH